MWKYMICVVWHFKNFIFPTITIIIYTVCMCTQSCLTLCDPIDYSPPASSVHGISQAKILAWVAISFSRGSSRPRDWTGISCVSYISRWILNILVIIKYFHINNHAYFFLLHTIESRCYELGKLLLSMKICFSTMTFAEKQRQLIYVQNKVMCIFI